MEFFTKKEEVFNIELTQLGRKALAEGNLNFKYYSFHDTDIVYDQRFNHITQSAFVQRDRIQETTQRLKLQSNFKPVLVSSPKTSVLKEENYEHHTFIGTSEINQRNWPALSIKLHSGKFTGSLSFESGIYSAQRIPILTIQSNHEFNYLTKQWEKDEFILLEVEELNGLYEKENFEIEILEVKNTNSTKFNELYFYEEQSTEDLRNEIIDEINSGILQNDDVKYYFSIQVDNYIESDFEIQSLPDEKQEEIRNIIYNSSNDAENC